MTHMKKLIYCTQCYPSDAYTEKVFVDTELKAMLRHFDQIILVPTKKVGMTLGFDRTLPDGVSVDWSLAESAIVHRRLRRITHSLPSQFFLEALSIMAREARTPKQWIKGILQASNIVTMSEVISRIAARHGCSPSDTVLYSLWFDDAAASLAHMAERDGWHMATRAHTADIYDEMMIFRSVGLRNRLLTNIDKVLVISTKGAEYLKAKFPEHTSKIIDHKLGSIRLLTPPVAHEEDNQDKCVVMTVGRIDSNKRFLLIFNILNIVAGLNPGREILWKAVGDGPLLQKLRATVQRDARANLKVELPGRMENADIQRIYSAGEIDWFMMMSEHEGIPVSIGEAMSYGVPVITTDVGSIPELVTSKTGHLYNADVNPKECATDISSYLFNREHKRQLGEASLERWSRIFDASHQAGETASVISDLIKELTKKEKNR